MDFGWPLWGGIAVAICEVANVAVFAASDWARTITASEINFTGGAVVD